MPSKYSANGKLHFWLRIRETEPDVSSWLKQKKIEQNICSIFKGNAISTTMKYKYNPIRLVKIKIADPVSVNEETGGTITFLYYWWNCKMAQPCWKTFFCRFFKIKNISTIWWSHFTLHCSPNVSENMYYTKTCTWLFMASSFVIDQMEN